MTHTKIAFITGGSRGLGRAGALALARDGVDVIVTYVSRKDDAESVVAEITAMGRKAAALHLDVGNVAGLHAFASELRAKLGAHWQRETFDFLVNNGGAGVNKPFPETTEADFDAMNGMLFKGVYFLTQALLPMISDGGKIVNVTTALTRYHTPGYSAYAAMKGAVEVLTKHLSKELAPRRITVNTLAPGAIETDFAGGRMRDDRQVNAAVAALTPLGRVGLPDDIGGALAALLSDRMGWVNGQRIEVAGGIH